MPAAKPKITAQLMKLTDTEIEERWPDHDGQWHPKRHVRFGGDMTNPTWQTYINRVCPRLRPHYSAIRKCIKDAQLLGAIANDYYEQCFVTSDGHFFAFSMRAWGDLMQAIVNKREGYMRYYF